MQRMHPEATGSTFSWPYGASELANAIPEEVSKLLFVGRRNWEVPVALNDELHTLQRRVDITAILPDFEEIHRGRQLSPTVEFLDREFSTYHKYNPALSWQAAVFMPVPHERVVPEKLKSGIARGCANMFGLLKPEGYLIVYDIMVDRAKGMQPCARDLLARLMSHEELARRFYDIVPERYHQHDVPLAHVLQALLAYTFQRPYAERRCLVVPRDWYNGMFQYYNMEVTHTSMHLPTMIAEQWREEFGLTEAELRTFHSFGLLVARKTRQLDWC